MGVHRVGGGLRSPPHALDGESHEYGNDDDQAGENHGLLPSMTPGARPPSAADPRCLHAAYIGNIKLANCF
jgi:hypothetical protein